MVKSTITRTEEGLVVINERDFSDFVDSVMVSGIPQEAIRTGGNVLTSLLQAAAGNNLAAAGGLVLTSALMRRARLIDQGTHNLITVGAAGWLGVETIGGVLQSAIPDGLLTSNTIQQTSITYDIPDQAVQPPRGGGGLGGVSIEGADISGILPFLPVGPGVVGEPRGPGVPPIVPIVPGVRPGAPQLGPGGRAPRIQAPRGVRDLGRLTEGPTGTLRPQPTLGQRLAAAAASGAQGAAALGSIPLTLTGPILFDPDSPLNRLLFGGSERGGGGGGFTG